MLLGTTYAWFTDSVVASKNRIVSGNLDIELDYAVYEDGVLSDWAPVDEDTNIFNENALYEPGYTEVVALRVRNVGTLALKYKIGVNIVSEKAGINVFGKAFNLSDYLYTGLVAEGAAAERNDYIPYATTKLSEATRDMTDENPKFGINTLVPNDGKEAGDDEEIFEIVVHMPTWVDNNANFLTNEADTFANQPEIILGLNLVATQLTYESDDFDDQYDADAEYGTYLELNEGDDLLAALASAEKNMPLTIKLNGDVEWPTEGHHGENDITPASSIVIVGDGHTITATGSGVTPLGDVEAPMTLKNVTIKDNSASYNEGAWELTYLEMGGTKLTCENVTFADEIQLGTNATFTNCSFESNEENVYAVWVDDGSATFTNCTFKGYRGLKTHEDYGSEVSAVIVKNCTFENISKKPGIALGTLNADTTVSITGSDFINCQAGDQGLYIYETDTDVTSFNFINENNKAYSKAIVSTADALAGALTSNAKDLVVTLSNDIDLSITSLGSITPGSGEYKLGGADTEAITIDLNGYKLNITTTYWSAIGAVNADATITIKNGSMTSTGNSAGTWNAYDVRLSNCNYVIENVVFEKAVALDNVGKSTTMENVTINEQSGDKYALWITAEGQNVTIDGLTINSTGRGIKIDEQYVDAAEKVTLNVSNATFNTVKKAAIMVKSIAGADITLDNIDISGVAADTTNAVWNDSDAAASFDKVTVTGGSVIQEA
jgi:predicted ribosomally synthesized peptide with SipW-like signal peptide